MTAGYTATVKDERSLPTGRFGRLGRLVSVGARAGLDLLSSRDSQRSAERAAEVLGTLRGLAAKVGQMASYVDGVIPEQHRTAYETAMGALVTHITGGAEAKTFQPMNVNFGLFPPIDAKGGRKGRKDRYKAYTDRAKISYSQWLAAQG